MKRGILFVHNFGPRTGFAWNTIETCFSMVAATLSKRGWACHIAYPSLAGAGSEPLGPLQPVEFDYSDASPANTLRLLRLLKRLHIGLLYLTDHCYLSLRYPLLRLAGCRIIVHARCSGPRTAPRGLKRWAKRLAHRLPSVTADRIIAVSSHVAEQWTGVGCVPPEKVVCSCNGVDVALFSPGEDRHALHDLLGIDPSRPVIFLASRAEFYKGIDVAIHAAHELVVKRGRPEVVFAYCGDGTQLAVWQRMAADMGLGAAFRFLGKRYDVHRLLPSATVALVPSIWSGYGRTAIEPMAAGVPLVASRVEGMDEVVRDGETGLLVEPGNPTALADAIAWLLDDPAARERLARQAREFVARELSIERNVAEIVSVFESVLDAEWPGRPSPTE